jgi:hypothetical protein
LEVGPQCHPPPGASVARELDPSISIRPNRESLGDVARVPETIDDHVHITPAGFIP